MAIATGAALAGIGKGIVAGGGKLLGAKGLGGLLGKGGALLGKLSGTSVAGASGSGLSGLMSGVGSLAQGAFPLLGPVSGILGGISAKNKAKAEERRRDRLMNQLRSMYDVNYAEGEQIDMDPFRRAEGGLMQQSADAIEMLAEGDQRGLQGGVQKVVEGTGTGLAAIEQGASNVIQGREARVRQGEFERMQRMAGLLGGEITGSQLKQRDMENLRGQRFQSGLMGAANLFAPGRMMGGNPNYYNSMMGPGMSQGSPFSSGFLTPGFNPSGSMFSGVGSGLSSSATQLMGGAPFSNQMITGSFGGNP